MPAAAGSDGALRLLLRICEAEPPEVMRQWISYSAAEAHFEFLTSIGALRHVGNASIVRCHACDETHEVAVEMLSSGRFRAFCPDAGYHDIPASDLTIHAADFGAIGNLIRRGLDLRTRGVPDELVEGSLWRLGERRFGRTVATIYFARRLGGADVLAAARRVLQTQPSASPGLILTSAAIDLPSGALPARYIVLPLSRYAEMKEDSLRIDEQGLQAALTANHAHPHPGATQFSPDYRHGVVGSERYSFSRKQAEAIRIMHEAHTQGFAPLDQRYILAEAGSDQRRLSFLSQGIRRGER